MSAPSALARDLRKLPNVITISRIFLLMLSIHLYFNVSSGWGLVVGTVAGFTDFVDGAVARATGQVSRLGEVLDQFSDLVFESIVLFLAAHAPGDYPKALLLVYLFREFWIVTIRRFMAEYRINIASNFLGKLKTNFICYGCIPAFISFAKLWPEAEPFAWYLGLYSISLGIFFGYVAAFDYSRQFIRGYNEVCR